jgi:hypothetical protein
VVWRIELDKPRRASQYWEQRIIPIGSDSLAGTQRMGPIEGSLVVPYGPPDLGVSG